MKSIRESDNAKFNDEITALTEKCEVLSQNLLNSNLSYKTLQEEYDELRKIMETLDEEEINEETIKPEWMSGQVRYTPRRRIVSKDNDVTLPFENPRHVFDKSTMLYDEMNAAGFLNQPLSYQLMYNIHKWMIRRIEYAFDKTDNWRPVTDVLMGGFGDCDDSGGVSITSALGMAGWRDDEVFCCVGWYYPSTNRNEKFYHSWCIARASDEWWVLEGTNSSAKPERITNMKEKYVIDDAWNWKYGGHVDMKKLLEE